MNTIIAIGLGLIVYIALMAAILAIMRTTRSDLEVTADDAEQVAAVSRPAALRPHIKAGTAWGKEQ